MRTILQAALNSVSPQVAMRQVRRLDDALILPDGAQVSLARKVRVVALGKAAGMMSAHAQPWGPIEEVLVSAPYKVDIPGFETYVGGHPLPDEESVKAGERALDLARATGPDDLLVLLLSGGASAMAEAPDVPLADLRRANELLLSSGAPIEELNLVRKQLSRLKGGGLARACGGELLALCISDVDDISTLGSGPAWPEAAIGGMARLTLERRGLWDAMPASVRERLMRPGSGADPDSGEGRVLDRPGAPPSTRLRPGLGPRFAPSRSRATPRHVVLADNETALTGAANAATRLGYRAHSMPGHLRGEAREKGAELGALARKPVDSLTAYILGGETTVHVVGHGKGGRNQELALASVDALSGREALLAAFATDGVDGPTDAAGAIVDGLTRARADALGLDSHAHLAENDSYPYFERLDDLIRTGVTGTNVRDVAVLLVRD